jgi:hypothetical protein
LRHPLFSVVKEGLASRWRSGRRGDENRSQHDHHGTGHSEQRLAAEEALAST